MNKLIGKVDVALIVLDSLRYDVAQTEWSTCRTPNLAAYLPPGGWEKRHSPGSFTYAAHQAFFAGFLPTPADPTSHKERLFATRFAGSETTGNNTFQVDTSDLVTGLRRHGYHTICSGGVGFFNQQTELSSVFPKFFDEAHWSEQTSVIAPDSTRHQVELAQQRASAIDSGKRIFWYFNLAAIHQPNKHYIEGKNKDDIETHAAALRYVDTHITALMNTLRKRNDLFILLGSDHGVLYGEEGFTGHRIGHKHVYTVPWAEFLLEQNGQVHHTPLDE
ncbi:STM4013/SEN3800 family hydrolase [Cerasicoccus arenae]|nr:STM4013/SEN3800 family hydrolase [Cerasicoccus arenae]